jgi:hypothetical protein
VQAQKNKMARSFDRSVQGQKQPELAWAVKDRGLISNKVGE